MTNDRTYLPGRMRGCNAWNCLTSSRSIPKDSTHTSHYDDAEPPSACIARIHPCTHAWLQELQPYIHSLRMLHACMRKLHSHMHNDIIAIAYRATTPTHAACIHACVHKPEPHACAHAYMHAYIVYACMPACMSA
jgi:hypothetical protein